jgi:hypothetical protein
MTNRGRWFHRFRQRRAAGRSINPGLKARNAPLRAVIAPRARSCRVPVVGPGSTLGCLSQGLCSDVAWSDHPVCWWCRAEEGPLVNAQHEDQPDLAPRSTVDPGLAGPPTCGCRGRRRNAPRPGPSWGRPTSFAFRQATRRDVTSWNTNSRNPAHTAGTVTPTGALSGEPRSPEVGADTSMRGPGRTKWRDCG